MCQPYCVPCAKAHTVLKQLIKNHPGEIGVIVRFIDGGNNNETDKGPVELIFNVIESTSEVAKPVSDWFHSMSNEDYLSVYSTKINNSENFHAYSRRTQEWLKTIQIKHTPTIFINGYEFAEPYTFQMLPDLIGTLIERMSTKGETCDVI